MACSVEAESQGRSVMEADCHVPFDCAQGGLWTPRNDCDDVIAGIPWPGLIRAMTVPLLILATTTAFRQQLPPSSRPKETVS